MSFNENSLVNTKVYKDTVPFRHIPRCCFLLRAQNAHHQSRLFCKPCRRLNRIFPGHFHFESDAHGADPVVSVVYKLHLFKVLLRPVWAPGMKVPFVNEGVFVAAVDHNHRSVLLGDRRSRGRLLPYGGFGFHPYANGTDAVAFGGVNKVGLNEIRLRPAWTLRIEVPIQIQRIFRPPVNRTQMIPKFHCRTPPIGFGFGLPVLRPR